MEVTAKMIGETISKLNREICKLTEIRDGITNGTAKMTANQFGETVIVDIRSYDGKVFRVAFAEADHGRE